MLSGVLQHIRRIASHGETYGDGELLSKFLKQRDNDALADLFARHGPMVWGVCRRLLRSHHDAEDAFQATFLVLVRKAATIRNRNDVANWLYGVAHQTAVRLRANLAKQHRREQQAVALPESGQEGKIVSELRPFLDEELSRLPDKYRALIVMCDLEGRTRKEVARELKCPEGTVAGRLARARLMLGKRLRRRGLLLGSGILPAALSREAAASVPLTVMAKAGMAGRASARVLALTDGVIRAMLIAKLKIATAVLLVVGLIACPSSTHLSSAAGEEKQERIHEDVAQGAASLVQIRTPSPVGMHVGLRPAGQTDDICEIHAPGRLNLAWGHVYRLKLSDIPQRPGSSYFPTIEIPTPDATTRPFVNDSAIPVEFTDEDFDYVDKGDRITKVIYLTRGRAATVTSCQFPDADVIQETRRRGAILAVVRMGDIDLQGHVLPTGPKNLVKIDIGDDGKLDVVRVRQDKPADQLERALLELANAQAKNKELKQQLKAMELEIKSLRTHVERKEREGKPPDRRQPPSHKS
jgi:RNA polymerase sigma factor (sigma-70 family)